MRAYVIATYARDRIVEPVDGRLYCVNSRFAVYILFFFYFFNGVECRAN